MNFMALDKNTTDMDSENWYVDNGATSHITNISDLFKGFEYFPGAHTVTTANDTVVHVIGKRNLEIEADARGVFGARVDFRGPFVRRSGGVGLYESRRGWCSLSMNCILTHMPYRSDGQGRQVIWFRF